MNTGFIFFKPAPAPAPSERTQADNLSQARLPANKRPGSPASKETTSSRSPRSPSRPDKNRPSTGLRSGRTPAAKQSPPSPVTTVARTQVQSARDRQIITRLDQSRRYSVPGSKERAAINKQMKTVREEAKQFFTAKRMQLGTFTDLEGNPVGFFFTQLSKTAENDALLVGSRTFVQALHFDFVRRKRHAVSPPATVLRLTAFLTDPGKDEILRYVKKRLKTSYGVVTSRPSRGRTITPVRNRNRFKKNRGRKGRGASQNSGRDIRQILKQRSTFNWQIEGAEAHLNTNGKVEIFVTLPRLPSALLDHRDIKGRRQLHRLRRAAQYSHLKKWIQTTDAEFNGLVADSFKTLSQVLNCILG